jgi:hypothetical protein
LSSAAFAEACRHAGLIITKPAEILARTPRSARHAA